MPPKKRLYTPALAHSWVNPPLSRPDSFDDSQLAKSNTPEKPQDHDTTKSSISSSRSKYANAIPSSWIVPSSFKEQSKQGNAVKGQNKPTMSVDATGWDAVKRLPHSPPPAPTDEFFPEHQAGFPERPAGGFPEGLKAAEQNQPPRSAAAARSATLAAASNLRSTTSPGSQTVLSSTSASCDLCAAPPRVSPTYSVL